MNLKPIYTCLWFNNNAHAAVEFYCSIFKYSKILEDNALVIMLELNGVEFMSLKVGPKYTHSPAVSFVIECDTQDEINYYWESSGKDAHYNQCG